MNWKEVFRCKKCKHVLVTSYDELVSVSINARHYFDTCYVVCEMLLILFKYMFDIMFLN